MRISSAYEKRDGEEEVTLEDDDDRPAATQYEVRLHQIFLRYLRGWLVMDFFSMVPSFLDVQLAFTTLDPPVGASGAANSTGGENAGGNNVAALKLTRTLKLFKMLKMARMLKMLKMLRLLKMIKFLSQDGPVKRTIDNLAVNFAQHARKVRVFRLLLMIFLIAHIFGCILGIGATFGDEKLASFWGTHGYCWPNELYQLSPAEPPISRCVGAFYQYFVCCASTGLTNSRPSR